MYLIVYCMASLLVCFFFFSSRRRHTRFDCDWSSDVCSSDLLADVDGLELAHLVAVHDARHDVRPHEDAVVREDVDRRQHLQGRDREALSVGVRSEERRVGKECRSRWEAYNLKERDGSTVRRG